MEWPRLRLDQLVTITKGKRPTTVCDRPDKVASSPYITIEAFETGAPTQFASSDCGEINTKPGDVLIVWDGARYGLVGRSPGGVLGSTLAVLTPTGNLDRDYLFYFLQSIHQHLRRVHRGTGIPHLDGARLAQTRIPLPPYSEQRRIVEILDQANQLRRLSAEADTRFEQILVAVYHKLFPDRDSTWPVEPLGKNLRGRRGALQSGPFGSQLHNSDFIDGGPVRVVGIDNVLDGRFVEGRNRRISAAKYDELKKFTLEPGDVLVTIMGTVGRSCVFPVLTEPAICTKHVYRIQLAETLDPEYVSATIRYSPRVRRQLGASITGQIVAGIKSNDLRRLLLPIPPLSLQRRFAEIARAHRQQADARLKRSTGIDTLFGVLMHRAFSGSLTASWREAHMKELLQEMDYQAKALAAAE